MAPNDPDGLGRTSLHYAALDGPVDQVRNLLAERSERRGDGQARVHAAALRMSAVPR